MSRAAAIIDRIVADLTELKKLLMASPLATDLDVSDDANDEELIDTWTASQRFNQPIDSVRWAAREKGIGVKVGSRWMISLAKAREYYAENG